MINLLHIYTATALSLAFFFPRRFSYKNCWLFPLYIASFAFYSFGRAIDIFMWKEFH